MTREEFLSSIEDPVRREMLTQLAGFIRKHDKSVKEVVGPMMGREALLYCLGTFPKYALTSTKGYMSLHSMVMYGCAPLREKFLEQLPGAKFQKGCLNFKKPEDLPMKIAEQMIKESAEVEFPPKEYLDRLNTR